MARAATAERGRWPPAAPAPGTEGLPRAFLQSLRTLFDILDDRRRGYVHLREIESRWQGADARELPRGVLEGLRRAAPASGYLTFERFVAGLRTSLPGADDGPRDPARSSARPGDSRKPLPPGPRPAPPQSPEPPSGPVEAAPCPAESARPQSAALERSPSADAGECRPPCPRGTETGSISPKGKGIIAGVLGEAWRFS